MTPKEKIALMTYKALALYLHVYPSERAKLKRLLGKRKTAQIRQAERTSPALGVTQKKLFL